MPSGDRSYLRPAAPPVIAEVAYNGPYVIHLAVFGNLNTANTQWIFIFDANAIPADGAISEVEPIPVGPNGIGSWTPALIARRFNTGLTFAISTTGPTLTKQTVPEMDYYVEGREP